MSEGRRQTQTGGREATGGHIPGDVALAVGAPNEQTPTGFAWCRLVDLARLETGHTPSRRVPEYWDGGTLPWIGVRDATGNHGRTIYATNEYITELGEQNSSTRLLPANTVCLSRTASVGYVVVMGVPMCTSQDFVNWVCGPDLDYRYLKYILLAEKQAFLRFSSGTTHQTVYFPEVKAFHVMVPTIAEQRAIAGVLGVLDDKIESNRRLVRILEQLGRAELATALVGSDGEAWEYAWPEMDLGDALSLIETGDRPKGGVGEIAHGVPSVGAESIVAPGVFDFSKTKFVPEEYFARMRRGVLQSGDVLLYKDGGTPGNFIPKVSMCQDGFPFDVAALNSHVYRLRVKAPYSQAFLYFWLSSQRLLDEMWLRGTGAAIPSLNSTNVKGLPFPAIPATRLAPVLPVVDEQMSRLHKAAKEQRTLEQLRDALLPELLSGRLRVREVEEMVGSV